MDIIYFSINIILIFLVVYIRALHWRNCENILDYECRYELLFFSSLALWEIFTCQKRNLFVTEIKTLWRDVNKI
jgi:hypothetical protein